MKFAVSLCFPKNQLYMEAEMPDIEAGFVGLLYFGIAAFLTMAVDVLRRVVKRRLEIWEAMNPVPKEQDTRDVD